MELTPKQRQHLKGLAHHLKPTVQVGDAGISSAVLEKVADELKSHELIKVKVAEGELTAKDAGVVLASGSSSALVQVIGRTVILYRPRKKDPVIVLPRAKKPAEPAPASADDLDDDSDE